MAIAYLGLGTNIGNKRRNMITAQHCWLKGWEIFSPFPGFYETEPVGVRVGELFLECGC